MKSTFLCLSHPDFHMPADARIGVGLDAQAYAQSIKDSGADAVVMFASCHYGHCYYPSKIGRQHPGLDYDLFGAISQACKRVGLGLVAYHSVFLNSEAIAQHPEWAFRADDTRADAGFDSDRYARICVNSPYLDEFFLPICREVLDGYSVDELLLDTMSGYRPCFCKWCQEAYQQPIPSKESDQGWLAYSQWYRKCFEVFYQRVIDELTETHPQVPVLFNWNWGMRQADTIPQNVKRLCADMIPTLAADASRFMAGSGLPFYYMTGRFQAGLGDWSTISTESLRYTAASTVAAGGSFYIIDRQLPDGTLQPQAYRTMREMFPWLQERRRWLLGAEPIKDTVVLWDDRTANGRHNEYYADPDQRKKRLRRYQGIGKILRDHGRHYIACGSSRLRDILDHVNLLIIPEPAGIDTKTLTALQLWLNNGGRLLWSLPPDTRELDHALLELAGVRAIDQDPLDYHYVETEPGLFDTVGATRWNLEIINAAARPLVRAGEPMRIGNAGQSFGHGRAPCQSESPWPWAVERKVGKGILRTICTPFSSTCMQWPHPRLEHLLIRLLDELHPHAPVRLYSHAQVELGCTQVGEDLVFHLVNQSARIDLGGYFFPVISHLPTITGVQVSVRTLEGQTVHHLPDEGIVPLSKIDGSDTPTIFTAADLVDLQSYIIPGYFKPNPK